MFKNFIFQGTRLAPETLKNLTLVEKNVFVFLC